MKDDDGGLLWMMPDEDRVKALAKSGRATREQIRERLNDLPAPPDLIVFTPESHFAAWIVGVCGAGGRTLSHKPLESIRAFWADAERIMGRPIPSAGAAVNRAVASAYAEARGDEVSGAYALPCAAAIPDSVFSSAVERARTLIRRDVPLLGTPSHDETTPPYVVLWDLRDDAVRAKIWR